MRVSGQPVRSQIFVQPQWYRVTSRFRSPNLLLYSWNLYPLIPPTQLPPTFLPIMDSTANRPSPLRVATVISFYMFAALVVCRLVVHLFIS